MAARDQLFLLPPLFPDPRAGQGPYHCPECVQVEGLLASFPFLRDRVEVRYIDFPRPRADVVALIGMENQSCPVLVFAGEPPAGFAAAGRATNGRSFASGYAAIAAAFAAAHGTSLPHP